MSMEYIRKHYGVPAKRGARVRFTPNGRDKPACEGVITGSSGAHLCIRLDGEKRPGKYHPTWEIGYL
jgi:hypothetical protein